jgi:photosynthetic reaction center M subunit
LVEGVDLANRTQWGGLFEPWRAGSATPSLGPIYLGTMGVDLAFSGTVWFVMVGAWFWDQAGFNPAVFLRDLFWLSLDPPARNTGCASRRSRKAATS